MDGTWRRRVVAGLAVLFLVGPALGSVELPQLGGAATGGVDPTTLLVVAGGGLLTTAISAVLVLKLVPLLFGGAGRLSRAFDRVAPDGESQTMRAGIIVVVAVNLVLVVGVTGIVIEDVRDGGPVAQSQEMIRDAGGLPENADVGSVDSGVVVAGVTTEDVPDRPSPDADGDLLADDWERAGETPSGAPLPDADPDRKDIYLVVSHGTVAEPLNESEEARLVRTWAEMPVSNPDGSTGIDLHLIDGGELNGTGDFGRISPRDVRESYTRERIGPGLCTYYGTAIGRMDGTRYLGYADVPGYASIVHGDTPDSVHGGAGLVGVVTHELLHNVVGTVGPGDSGHTNEGWLSEPNGGPRNELSATSARRLNETGFAFPDANHGYYTQLCSSDDGDG